MTTTPPPPEGQQPPPWAEPAPLPSRAERTPRQSRGTFRRVMGWVIIAWNVLMLVAVIATLNISSSCSGMTGDELSACQAGEGLGKGAVVVIILLLWALVDVILLVLFLVARRRGEAH